MIIKNIIICEDIRTEVGNKISAMGILGSALNLERHNTSPRENPERLSLAFLISLFGDTTESDPKDIIVRIAVSLGKNPLFKIIAKPQSQGEGMISHIPIQRVSFDVAANTSLSVHAQVMKNDIVVSEETSVLDIRLGKTQNNKTPNHTQDKILNPTR